MRSSSGARAAAPDVEVRRLLAEGGDMRGVITLRDVLANGGLVLREFGAGCFLRCLLATLRRRPTTFLELAFPARRS